MGMTPIDLENARFRLHQYGVLTHEYADAALAELETARAKIAELREALAAAKLFGNDGETHEGKSVSYMIEKALTGTAGRSGE